MSSSADDISSIDELDYDMDDDDVGRLRLDDDDVGMLLLVDDCANTQTTSSSSDVLRQNDTSAIPLGVNFENDVIVDANCWYVANCDDDYDEGPAVDGLEGFRSLSGSEALVGKLIAVPDRQTVLRSLSSS